MFRRRYKAFKIKLNQIEQVFDLELRTYYFDIQRFK